MRLLAEVPVRPGGARAARRGSAGLVLAGTFGFAAFDALGVILGGGSETPIGSALLYAVVTLVVAGAIGALAGVVSGAITT